MTTPAAAPAQARARVVAAEDTGAYRHLVLAAPAAARARPGQFVALAVGGASSAMLLRRAFSVHRADPVAGTVDVVVAAHGAGTAWVCERRVGDEVDVVGPVGTGFTLPSAGERLVLVGGGYGSAPFAWTASAAAAGVVVDAVVGAGDAARLCDVDGIRDAVRATGGRLLVTTDDGSAGRRGRVTDALADLLADGSTGRTTVAGCGPMAMLAAVAATSREASRATGHEVGVQVAVEEAMACGIGICMTCVLPVRGDDGLTRMLRACTDGPVLDADRVRWDCVGPHGVSVPADAVGAPEGGAA